MLESRFILIICLLTLGTVQAQTQKGSFLIGGSLNYAHQKNSSTPPIYYAPTDDGSSQFNLSPKLGYFLLKNFAIGLDLNLGLEKRKYNYAGPADEPLKVKETSTALLLGPFLKYYILFNSKIGLFAEAGFFIGPGSNKNIQSSPYPFTSKTSTFRTLFNIGPGFTYFLNKNVGLEASLQYAVNSSKYTSSISFTDPNGNPTGGSPKYRTNSLLLNLGFQIYLNKQ